jgi:hypothetical protein
VGKAKCAHQISETWWARRAAPLPTLLLIFFLAPVNALSLSELFVEPQSQDALPFILNQSKSAAISEMRISFLQGEDCYSGFMQTYFNRSQENAFHLQPNQVFALDGRQIYQAAQIAVGVPEIAKIHAILLRFMDHNHGQRYEQFARFTGTCQDQGINCCLPITCSVNAGVCTAKYPMNAQPIEWK